jgi:predicted dehydrogenase
MSVPRDRTGGPVVVTVGERTLSGAELHQELGGFELDGVTATLFGPAGTQYDLPFEDVDAATIAIEIDDFLAAVADRRPPEVDGVGGLDAVAAVWAVAESGSSGAWVSIADVADGTISAAQDPIDDAIGLRGRGDGVWV